MNLKSQIEEILKTESLGTVEYDATNFVEKFEFTEGEITKATDAILSAVLAIPELQDEEPDIGGNIAVMAIYQGRNQLREALKYRITGGSDGE